MRTFTGALEGAGIRISMDGRGWASDSIFIECLWHTVRQEYIRDYASLSALTCGLQAYFRTHNRERYAQRLTYARQGAVCC
ncbi:MAG: hypothetical protein MUQ30_02835 [Anaerolineae bacterium]|nr:hypothetical protein [Anaerolineae bacterium]